MPSERHDLDAMAARGHRRDAAPDRLQPEQPDRHRAAGRRDRRLRRRRCRATSRVILDEAYVEFSALQDPDDVARPARSATPTWSLLRTFSKVYGLCGLRVGYALCGRGVPARRRPRAPAVLGQRARPGGRGRGAPPPGRGRAARRARRSSSASGSRSELRARGLETTDSQANFFWVRSATRDEADGRRRARRARRDRARRRGARRARAACASRYGTRRRRTSASSPRSTSCSRRWRLRASRSPATNRGRWPAPHADHHRRPPGVRGVPRTPIWRFS